MSATGTGTAGNAKTIATSGASARRASVGRVPLATRWRQLARLPFGRRLFSWLVGRTAPYSGTIGATVLELREGCARVRLRDRRRVRNHLGSVHAIALINLGEIATGLCLLHTIDGRGRGILRGIRMRYEKKARGPITAECRYEVPVAAGVHELEVPGELRDGAGEVVARVVAEWKVEIYDG